MVKSHTNNQINCQKANRERLLYSSYILQSETKTKLNTEAQYIVFQGQKEIDNTRQLPRLESNILQAVERINQSA